MPDTVSLEAKASGSQDPGTADPARKRVRRAEDTISGCEALAVSDFTRAAAMDTHNGRLKLEHSAAAWQARAVLLKRMKASTDKRLALDAVAARTPERL